MSIRCIWEHNGGDSLLYAADYPGVCARGPSLDVARGKMAGEVRAYLRWRGGGGLDAGEVEIVQEQASSLDIRDADSDVLFAQEAVPLTWEDYARLKALALKSARDFLRLYEAIPDKRVSVLPPRRTFYGLVPRTAEEMYLHTRNVNDYYFSEIGVEAGNEGTILECRERGFRLLEQQPGFLFQGPQEGSYGEAWSVGKVLRRFLWHDRIHAKAMYRMANKTFGANSVPNVFHFAL